MDFLPASAAMVHQLVRSSLNAVVRAFAVFSSQLTKQAALLPSAIPALLTPKYVYGRSTGSSTDQSERVDTSTWLRWASSAHCNTSRPSERTYRCEMLPAGS